ncbi:MAG TPA: MFS transporter [Candidatus Limnocylindria bacterium]|nr:MFS transporter [Candidatus Limnocylindria bacterium]
MLATAVTTAEGTLGLLYAPYLDRHGYAVPAIGSLSALFAIFRLISRVPSGAAYQPERAKRQLVFWLLVFAASTSGFAFAAGSFPLVAGLTILHGYAFGALGTYNLAVTIDLTGGQRAGAVMGWYTAALSTGYAIGAFAGGALADRIGLEPTLAVIGALPVTATARVLFRPGMVTSPHAERRAPGLRGLFAAHRGVDPRVWLAFLIGLYINLVSDALDTFFPLFGLSVGIPLATSGALQGVKSGAATFIRFISGAVFRYVDHRSVNFWSVLLLGASTIAIGFVSSLGLFFVLFLACGIARGLLRVTSAAAIADVRADGRDVGIASGVYNMGLDLGAIAGPAIAGLVGDLVGLRAMFQLVAFGSLAVYFTVALATPQGRATLAIGRSRPARAGW